MKSRIYDGVVKHDRRLPQRHNFRYRVCQLYLDLDELPTVFDGHWLWSTRRSALARFKRCDHLGPQDVSLPQAVRAVVERETGVQPSGPIRLLTHLRYFGHGFNPVSFYYCFDAAGRDVEFVVAEVNNTPWHEQHAYVLDCRDCATSHAGVAAQAGAAAKAWTFEFDKRFHVSPFMAMQQRYRWRFNTPDEYLRVHMENIEDDEVLFNASMVLREHPLDSRGLARVLLRYPMMTVQVVIAIHWQALRLWLKGVPVHDHPRHLHDSEVNQ
jgi:DUF1365 family protein